MPNRRKRRLNRWALRIAAVLGLAAAVTLPVVWLAAQHIPAWYDPPAPTEADIVRVRSEVPATYQAFTDALVAGQPFEFELSAGAVNEWIACSEELWPQSHRSIPDWIQSPVVAFDDGRASLAARVERGNWRAIGSVHIEAECLGDQLVLRLSCAVGSLPLPIGPMLRALADRVRSTDSEGPRARLRKLLDRANDGHGMTIENRFFWSNGERYFRLRDLTAEAGVLRLSIDPL